ncbi:MAG: hypothetical protein AAGH15_07110 [Myxococcota bacterium]
MADKRDVMAALIAKLEAEHAALVAKARDAARAATHEEARPENDKDTRAIEASYLARGQAARVEELGETITRLRFVELKDRRGAPAEPGCLVELEADGEAGTYFLLPVGGGEILDVDGLAVRTLTPAAPLGRALVGKRPGDDFELRVGKTLRELVVLTVR